MHKEETEMSEQKEEKSVLLEEAKKLRELVECVIARLESGEPGPALRNEIEELRERVIELLQRMEDVRMEDIMEKVKQHTTDARKKFQDVLSNIGPSLDEASRKAQRIVGDWFSGDATSREELKAVIMSEDFTAEYFQTMRSRNWNDQGIRESLDVLRQILLSRI
jgi:predicted nuclease with TOPRIM domain